jgi:PAS domain S-box-containing protein
MEEEFSVMEANLQSIGKLKANFVDKWYQERYSDASFLHNEMSYLGEPIRELIAGPSASDSIMLASHLFPMYNNHGYTNIFIADKNNNVIVSLNPLSSVNVNPALVLSAAENKKLLFSSIYSDSSFIYLDIYIPIFNNDKFLATVILKIDPGKLLFPLISDWYEANSSGESLLISHEGDSILYLSPLKYSVKPQITNLPASDPELLSSEIVKGIDGIVQGYDYRGVEVLADVRKLKIGNWYLITKTDLKEIYLPVKNKFGNYVIILTLIVFLGGLSLLFYHNRINYNNLKMVNESERKLKQILEHSTNLFYAHTTNNIITYVSPQSYNIFGYKPEELMINWHSLTTDNPVNQTGGELTEKAILTGEVQPSYELELKKKDGTHVWVEVHEAPVLKDGKTVAMVGSLTPVTQHKIAQKALYESEEIFRHFMENSPYYVFFKDHEIRALRLSNNYEQMLGRPLNEILGKTMDELFPSELAKSMIEDDKKILYEGKTVVVNEEFNGRYYNTIKFPIKIDGEFRYLAGYSIDITDKKLAEDHIKTLSQALEQSPVSIVITDPSGNIEYVNPKFTEVTEYDVHEVIGKNPRLLKSGELQEEDYRLLWETISRGNEWRGELHNRKKSGEMYWVDAIISPIVSSSGEVLHYIGIEEDITGKKKMIEELIISKEKAEEMNRIKSYFFANMSHELRTPFVGIIGYAELLLQILKDQDSRDMVESILFSSNNLMETLNKILTLTKIEFEPPASVITQVDINELLDECYVTFYPAACRKKLELRLNRLRYPMFINSDRRMLREILINLISNAIKYTNEGYVEVDSALSGNGSLYITISDTGIGIPKEKHDQIWLAFRQVSEGFNRSFQGTGLGLTITKKYTEILGGNIFLESSSKGSKFVLEIPLNNKI